MGHLLLFVGKACILFAIGCLLFNAVLVGHISLYNLYPWIIFNAVLVSLISMCILFLCIFCGNALEQSELFRPGAPDLKQHIGYDLPSAIIFLSLLPQAYV